MAEHSAETRGLKIALGSYITLFALQLATYFATGILVLFAQALEVLSDVMVSAFLLLSIVWSRKPADEIHMFGHGRAQNVAALVSAIILIVFMSLEVFREAIPKFFRLPEASEIQNTNLAWIIIVASMIVLIFPLVDIMMVKAKGASARAQLIQIAKDEITYVPALLSVILVAHGYYLADPIASVFIGVIIVLSGVYLFKDNVHYLIGRAPGKEFADKVELAARSVAGVLGIHDFKAEYVGPNIVHTGFHIEVAKGTLVEEADRIAHEVEVRVRRETGCQGCVIHVDPSN